MPARPILAALCAALFAAAHAMPGEAQPQTGLCADAPSNAEYGACLQAALADAEAELDGVLQDVLARIDAAEFPGREKRAEWRDSMLAAQASWQIFRNRDCGVMIFEFWGGSGAGSFMTECRIAHTLDRTEALRARYDLAAAAGADAYLGRWATRPAGQTASIAEICAGERFGFMEITPRAVYEYEMECDVRGLMSEGDAVRLELSCSAEGMDFTAFKTIVMEGPDRMRVEEYVPDWQQRETAVYQRCN